MKTIAMHLPQYYENEENNEWWGKGFTDWVNVKKAQPLFKNHYQPVIPLNDNYYDMTDLETLNNQANLANKYGLYGFCYYHYWFNGKLLLNKPCEILLKHKEINENYCFCWANETWARTWDGKENDILIKQEYGGKKDWEKHIKYLMKFFRDSRYIKIDNKPVMFFYSPSRIENFNEMIEYWSDTLKKESFDGIYVVEFVNSFNNGKKDIKSDVLVEFEPHCACRYSIPNITKAKRVVCKKLGLIDYLSYDKIWKAIINNKEDYGGKRLWRSGFVNFDNSPRKGKKGMILKGGTPTKFSYYLEELCKSKNRNYVDDIVVINAWNEWAEGATLEPNKKFGYQYLEAIKKVEKL